MKYQISGISGEESNEPHDYDVSLAFLDVLRTTIALFCPLCQPLSIRLMDLFEANLRSSDPSFYTFRGGRETGRGIGWSEGGPLEGRRHDLGFNFRLTADPNGKMR